MLLPAEIQVRISSEAAGTISITPVVTQRLPFRDLVEVILGSAGKDAGRVREVLQRGAVVQGASRFRWEPVSAEPDELAALLETFPSADPSRPFRADQCFAVRIRTGSQVVEMSRESASRRGLFRRRSLWDELMALTEGATLEYIDYSYRVKADVYRLRLKHSNHELLQTAEWVEFLCAAGPRPAAGS